MKHLKTDENLLGIPKGILTPSQLEELDRTRKAIQAEARRKVDPDGTGFDAQMAGSDDGGFAFNTDQYYEDWLDWAENLLNIISIISQRVTLVVAAVGFAITGAILTGSERGAVMGQACLIASGIFAVWFAATNIMGTKARR